ncbi:MAG: riboflavin biosynthesis protein RibF [Clostridia bacterium]|nr:riboflavin biosynthesis protein RibF [Clostridia bacterium]
MSIRCISLQTFQELPISEANILCLGNFDGVHMGHRALLNAAKELQKSRFSHAACGVFCFETLPADSLSLSPPMHLCTLTQKMEYFRDAEMDFVILADFPSMKELSPETFVQQILLRDCHCVSAVCGFNYHYGKNGSGNTETLRQTLPVPVTVVDKVTYMGKTVSSSTIRTLLSEGKVEQAACLLERPYCFCAPVEHGKALGRRLGAPTMNQRFPARMQILHRGVYVTEALIDGIRYRGVTNVGTHPTVDTDAALNCETYLLDFDREIYGVEVELSFLAFLRPEQKFESTEALRAQIAKDIEAAKAF